ncbi:hypothetical protein DID78_04875 [Candidatus Marinamargulisbacteria bacterium SCGC AG-343-D04]|nr:hypothetical protein DID78_04875 [Candidatus Marinamargulisbacteria bacterium SCGC AG-343-D04]
MVNKIIWKIIFLIGVLAMTSSCQEEQLDTSLLKNKDNPVAKIETTMGDIFIELYQEDAPVSVANFLEYVEDDFYSGTIFHRVIDGFMIQGGGFESGFKEKATKDPIKNEAINGVSNDRGTIAMARTNIIDSATSQFFINVKDNDFLNHQDNTPPRYGYAVFGKVVEGLDVVDQIKSVKTASVPPYDDVPVSDVMIDKVIIIKK